MNDDKLYQDAWEKWGSVLQLNMINEECAELIKEVSKYIRHDEKGSIEPIIEEMADVSIMIEQFLFIFGQTSEFRMIKAKKLDRLTEKVYQK